MYHVIAQGVDERMINVHYYYISTKRARRVCSWSWQVLFVRLQDLFFCWLFTVACLLRTLFFVFQKTCLSLCAWTCLVVGKHILLARWLHMPCILRWLHMPCILRWLHMPCILRWLHMPCILRWLHMPCILRWLHMPCILRCYVLCSLCIIIIIDHFWIALSSAVEQRLYSFVTRGFNIHRSDVLAALSSCCMAGATWSWCRFGACSLCTIQPCTTLQCQFIQSHISREQIGLCMCVQL